MSTEIFQVKGEKFQKKNFMQATSRLLQLTDDPTVRKALLQIVIALEDNFHAREDLLQEALLHFWSRERQCPGRPLGWYVQALNIISKISGLPDADWTHPNAAGRRQRLRTIAMDGTNCGTALISTKALCPQFTLTIS